MVLFIFFEASKFEFELPHVLGSYGHVYHLIEVDKALAVQYSRVQLLSVLSEGQQ